MLSFVVVIFGLSRGHCFLSGRFVHVGVTEGFRLIHLYFVVVDLCSLFGILSINDLVWGGSPQLRTQLNDYYFGFEEWEL